jgi:hypothetical protein
MDRITARYTSCIASMDPKNPCVSLGDHYSLFLTDYWDLTLLSINDNIGFYSNESRWSKIQYVLIFCFILLGLS